MTAWAYYNEIDPHAAQWLRNLMDLGAIAPGYVDERSIADVLPDELAGFAQCHFFAGIGVWSAALRSAGWDDHRPAWTGSCPCQPFSTAGRGEGFADERHLWPAFFHLITQRRPSVVFGEQVASSDADDWIELVQNDMEGVEYAFGATPFPSAGVGAPHIRDRLWWVAHLASERRAVRGAGGARGERRSAQGGRQLAGDRLGPAADGGIPRLMADMHGHGRAQGGERQPEAGQDGAVGDGAAGRLADGHSQRREGPAGLPGGRLGETGASSDGGTGVMGVAAGAGWEGFADGRGDVQRPRRAAAQRAGGEPAGRVEAGAVGDARGDGVGEHAGQLRRHEGEHEVRPPHGDHAPVAAGAAGHHGRPGPTNGFWRDPDWLLCRDGLWRPVEPGTFPLVDGSAFRVGSGSTFEGRSRAGMLKGYGNAINKEAAEVFIRAVMECQP